MVPADQLIDVCPRCGMEVFYTSLPGKTFKCVEETCEWTGKEPILKLRKNYEF